MYMHSEISVELFNALVGQSFTVLSAPAGALFVYERSSSIL